MFLRRLNSRGLSPLSRTVFISLSHFNPHCPPSLPHRWWSVRGFSPWPLQPLIALCFTGSLPQTHSGAGRCGFHSSTGLLMERVDRGREPPLKRKKSEEEKSRAESREVGARGGKVREQLHPCPEVEPRQRPHNQFREGSRDGQRNRPEKSRESSRDSYSERTKSASKGGKDGNWRRCKRLQEGDKDAQPSTSRLQSGHQSKPQPCPVPTPRPNVWFRERGTEEPPEEQRRGRGGGGPGPGLRTRLPPHPGTKTCNRSGDGEEPPSPGTFQTRVREEEAAPPVTTLQRYWETSPHSSSSIQPPGVSTVFDFSVMSYNILSQELLQDNMYLYHHCDPRVLPWEYRLSNLLSEIQLHDADILCLQEVQEDHYSNQLQPALRRLGYHCEFKKRTGSKPDGCAIIFKSSRLSLVSSNPVEYFRSGDTLLDRDNVGLVVLLRPNSAEADPSALVCIANTHLLYNPRRGDIKLAQLAILLAEISQLSRCPDGSTNPVLLCGDFNSTPWSPLYNFLTTGCLDYRGLTIGMVSGQENTPRGQRLLSCPIWSDSLGINHGCQYNNKPTTDSSLSPSAVEGAISDLTVEDVEGKSAAVHRMKIEHSLKLMSTYQHCLLPDGRPEITTCHSRTAITVDYIMFTPEVPAGPSRGEGRGLELLGRLSLVGQSELREVNFLPNRRHPSDHLPLLARFRLRLL